MTRELSEDTGLNISIKTLIGIAFAIATVVGMWYALQSDIEEAKELPAPNISRTEYELKDEMVRDAIMNTQDDVEEIKKQLDKIEDRLFESR